MLITLGVTAFILFIVFCCLCLFAVMSRINDAEPPVKEYDESSAGTDREAVSRSSLKPTI